jgi:hypothetical protein
VRKDEPIKVETMMIGYYRQEFSLNINTLSAWEQKAMSTLNNLERVINDIIGSALKIARQRLFGVQFGC